MRQRRLAVLLSALLPVLAAGTADAQATLSLALDAPHPFSFNTGPGGTAAQLTNIVRTEPLHVTLVETPTPPGPTIQLVPRRVALYVGALDPTPLVLPEGSIFIDIGASVPPIAVFSSFLDPLGPIFGPPLGAAQNTLKFTLGANLFPPLYPASLPTLALQALAEDTPGNPFLVSNVVQFQLVDPEIAGLAPAVTDIDPKAPTGTGNLRPQGPETGGNTVTLSGLRFPAQSNWIQFPPTILFGGVPATGVWPLSNTSVTCVVPPRPFLTVPPDSDACLADVVFVNHPAVSPSAQPHVSAVPYLYLSGVAPVITGFTPPSTSPEGGATITIHGSGFLKRGLITIERPGHPSATTVIAPPDSAFGPGGTTITFTAPPYCTGIVDIRVTNCDEVVSNTMPLVYDELPPVISAILPTVTLPPWLGGGTYPTVTDTGTAIDVTGERFIRDGSPILCANAVPPPLCSGPPPTITGTVFPTRAFLFDVEQIDPQKTVPDAQTLHLTTNSFDQTGLVRGLLGFKPFRVENPPCVRAGNTANLPSPDVDVIVRDGAPPSITDAEPLISKNVGPRRVTVFGQNLFMREGSPTQDFTEIATATSNGQITAIDPTAIRVPAVKFGDYFARQVTLISETELDIQPPDPPVAPGTSIVVEVTIVNPDTRSSSLSFLFTFVPPLVDQDHHSMPEGDRVLDGDFLRDVVAAVAAPNTPNATPASVAGISFRRNPAFRRDAARYFGGDDPAYVPDPAEEFLMDRMFLFDTATDALPPLLRYFDFDRIEIPLLLTGIDDPYDGSAALVDKIVILKARGGADVTPAVDAARNFPLVLRSKDDLRLDGLLDVSGDAFASDALLFGPVAFQGRVEPGSTPPPAGSGRGGRGGAHYPETPVLPSLMPPPNFGATSVSLSGGPGSPPPLRPLATGSSPTYGTGGGGIAPIGGEAAGGGGAGGALPGLPGEVGAGAPSFGGFAFGNASRFGTAGALGLPLDDRKIFGDSTFAGSGIVGQGYSVFQTSPAIPPLAGTGAFNEGGMNNTFANLIAGGSGGGGGGGTTSILIPCVSLGGRGGNGGGAAILLSDRKTFFGAGARIWADGETGLPGIDAFPAANQNPIFLFCQAASGGGGSGGAVYILSIVDVCFAAFTCTSTGPEPGPAPAAPVIDARAGAGGAQPPIVQLATSDGGAAGPGRIRIAVNAASPYLAAFRSRVLSLFQPFDPLVPGHAPLTPAPLLSGAADPAAELIATGWFQYVNSEN